MVRCTHPVLPYLSMVGSTIMDITYGFDVQDENNPFLALGESATNAAGESGTSVLTLVRPQPHTTKLSDRFS